MLSQMVKLKRQSLFADRKAVISQGMLKCVGSSIFLKSKWGIGYRLRYRSFFFFFELFLFIKFLAAGSPLLCGLPPFSASRGCCSARCAASHRRGLACGAQALGRAGFSSAAPRHGRSGCDAHGLAAPGHRGPSWIRDQTRVSCFGSWILYH